MQTKHVSSSGWRLKATIVALMIAAGIAGQKEHIGEQEVEIVYETDTSKPKSILAGKRIVILPGHGGTNDKDKEETGTQYKLGQKIYYEKDITLQTSKVLKHILKQNGAIVFMSREKDTYLSSKEQAIFANRQTPQLIISLHTNNADSNEATGIEVWGYKSCDKDLMDEIHKKFEEVHGFNVRDKRYNKWDVLRKTQYPATLIEMGFRKDIRKMIDPKFQQKFSEKLKEALEEYFRRGYRSSCKTVRYKNVSIKKPMVEVPQVRNKDKKDSYRLARR
jgi:N-acetylmuramoyl-L-alanine amidase